MTSKSSFQLAIIATVVVSGCLDRKQSDVDANQDLGEVAASLADANADLKISIDGARLDNGPGETAPSMDGAADAPFDAPTEIDAPELLDAGAGGATGSGGIGSLGSGGRGGVGGGVVDAPADRGQLLPSGVPCSANGDCNTGFCVDGICCATACSGCNACTNALTGKADGTCAAVLTGTDPHGQCTDETASNQCGNDGTCDGNGACRKVSMSHVCKAASCSTDGKTFTPATTCDGAGACTVAAPQSCGVFQCSTTGCLKTCTTSADCGGGNYCDTGAGTCAASKPNGTAATKKEECTSGFVADGVCCDKDCTGCSACTSALNGQAASTTGQCLPVVANKTAPHSACAANPPCGLDGTCDGSGNCHYPTVGTACANPSCSGSSLTTSACDAAHACTPLTKPCDGALVCDATGTACKTGACTGDSDCITGYYCASGVCTIKVDDAGTCSTNGQCKNGNCVSGVCCHTACGECNSCSTGTCTAVGNGTGCGSSQVCVSGSCQSGCWINGSLVSSGSSNPSNACQACTPTANRTGWSAAANGTSCGTGMICNAGSCQTGCYISSTVYSSGALNSSNSCQLCSPSMSTTSWYQTPSSCATLAAHSGFTCAAVGGVAKCWGSNANGGSLGIGQTPSAVPYYPTPYQLPKWSSGVQAVSSGNGSAHSCALVAGGVQCWGWNNNGQLGNASTSDSNVPVQVSGITAGAAGVATGDWHSCALLSSGGQVKCWGYNYNGQLGSPTSSQVSTTPIVAGITGASALSLGSSHSCALAGGTVYCWGANFYGQLGLGAGATTQNQTPTQVPGAGSSAQAITTGSNHSCSLEGGIVRCWGRNVFGQLGDGSTTDRPSPVAVINLPAGVQAISAGTMHTCAVANGGVYCWGGNLSGQLGDNSTTDRWSPVPVYNLSSGVQMVTAGSDHTCALLMSGGAKCWGNNYNGNLGNNSTVSSLTPVTVQGL